METQRAHLDPTKTLALLGLLGCLGLGTACGQEDPAPPPSEPQPYHPLVSGSWWEYAHTNWTERVELTAMDDGTSFVMADTPNPRDDEPLRSDSVLSSVGGRVVRLTKEEFLVRPDGEEVLTASVTYGVGFTRFNEDWANQAVGYRETPEYMRVETPAGAAPRPAEPRRHTFEIISLSEEVTTGRGRFDCIVIRRTKDWEAEEQGIDVSDAETKTFWFARGVGKVQERNEDSGNTEVLIDYFIPGVGD